jgi:hypothetical protein
LYIFKTMSTEIIQNFIQYINSLGNGPETGAFTEDSFLVLQGLAELYTSVSKTDFKQETLLEILKDLLLISWKVHKKMLLAEDVVIKNKN